MSEFKREDRYIIIKRSDLKKVPVAYRSALVDPMFSLLSHLPRRECVVVEHDWPEYHLVWSMIEHRIAGKPVPNFNDWRRADELQQRLTVADERADVLEQALKFYADREHYHFESGNWDTVSGEPLNIMWNGDEPDFIEDGSVARTALKPADGSRPTTCTWSEGGFSWHTGCGKEWQFTDGGLPSENGMRFCHSCGKTLVVESAEYA